MLNMDHQALGEKKPQELCFRLSVHGLALDFSPSTRSNQAGNSMVVSCVMNGKTNCCCCLAVTFRCSPPPRTAVHAQHGKDDNAHHTSIHQTIKPFQNALGDVHWGLIDRAGHVWASGSRGCHHVAPNGGVSTRPRTGCAVCCRRAQRVGRPEVRRVGAVQG